MCTCHFCNTEKGGVTPISVEGVIGTGLHYFFPNRTLSKPTFSILGSKRSTHSFTPEMGFDSIQKNQKIATGSDKLGISGVGGDVGGNQIT